MEKGEDLNETTAKNRLVLFQYYSLSGQVFDWCSHAFTTCTGTTPAGTQMYMQNKTNIFYRRQ
jgi:hypothetical protein